MSQSQKEKVLAFYDLAMSSPREAFEKFAAEDFQWINPLPENIPFGGTYHGMKGLFKYLTELDAAIEMSPLHFDEIISENGLVSAIGVEKDTLVKSTGKKYTMPFVHVLNFNDDGKLSQVREYNDVTDMLRAFKSD